MNYGYARVSSVGQKIKREIRYSTRFLEPSP